MKLPPYTMYVLYAAFLFWPSIYRNTFYVLVNAYFIVSRCFKHHFISATLHTLINKKVVNGWLGSSQILEPKFNNSK